MRIKLLRGRATDESSDPPGAIIEVPDDEAARMLNDGLAEPAPRLPEPATATRGAKRS